MNSLFQQVVLRLQNLCQLGDIELLITNTAGIYFINTNQNKNFLRNSEINRKAKNFSKSGHPVEIYTEVDCIFNPFMREAVII